MEYGHIDDYLFTDSTLLYTGSGQSRRSAYTGPIPNPILPRLPQLEAPLPHSGHHDTHNVFGLLDQEDSNLPDRQRSDLDEAASENVWSHQYLENSNKTPSESDDSGYDTTLQGLGANATFDELLAISNDPFLRYPYDPSASMLPTEVMPTETSGQSPQDVQPLDVALQDDPQSGFPTSPTSKRPRPSDSTSLLDYTDSSHERVNKIARLDRAQLKGLGSQFPPVGTSSTTDSTGFLQDYNRRALSPSTAEQTDVLSLSHKQKKFIKHWYKDFVEADDEPFLANEHLTFLATLAKASPQAVWEYISRRYLESKTHETTGSLPLSGGFRPQIESKDIDSSSTGYSLAKANRHLSKQTVELIERYVLSCQKRRAHSDGRRKKNDGPFICTFKCGYRTSRAFDWRRHEETHEPQELWLCSLCPQNTEQNPFLVNRKDKFLKHVKEAHTGWPADDVLKTSRVDFQSKFDRECPMCHDITESWDDRCRHIIGHYEDDVIKSARKSPEKPGKKKRRRSTSEEDSSKAELDTHDSSDDMDDGSSSLQQGANTTTQSRVLGVGSGRHSYKSGREDHSSSQGKENHTRLSSDNNHSNMYASDVRRTKLPYGIHHVCPRSVSQRSPQRKKSLTLRPAVSPRTFIGLLSNVDIPPTRWIQT